LHSFSINLNFSLTKGISMSEKIGNFGSTLLTPADYLVSCAVSLPKDIRAYKKGDSGFGKTLGKLILKTIGVAIALIATLP